jgi:RNA polymerase sigma factor (sigma-70 family)
MNNEQRQQLFNDNTALVYHIAARYKCPIEDEEDMIQEGLEALWRATATYDPSKARFSTFAGVAIQHAFEEFLGQAWNSSGLSACSWTRKKAFKALNSGGKMQPGWDRLFDTALSTDYKLDRDASNDDTTIADMLPVEDDYTAMEIDEMRSVIQCALEKLGNEDRRILTLRYGLDGKAPRPLREVGKEMGYSYEKTRGKVAIAEDHLAGVLPASAISLIQSL